MKKTTEWVLSKLYTMIYQTFLPPVSLRPYVRYFCHLATDDPEGRKKIYRTIADGYPGIIFQARANGRLFRDQKELPTTFLFGQSTTHSDIYLSGNFKAVCVFLSPNALNSVFKMNAEELTDSCLDLNVFSKSPDFSLSERLENAPEIHQQIDIITSYLVSHLERHPPRQDVIMNCVLDHIIQSKGTLSLKSLQAGSGLPERSFERKFKQYIGISPKLFSRICRFQSSLKQLHKNEFVKLSDIAYENDYADQSHFIRSFKEFAGLPPHQYQNQVREVAENLTALQL